MKKKLSVLLAALTIASVTSCPVMAAQPLTLPNDNGIVQPRYKNISYLGINFDRYGSIQADVMMNNDYCYVLTVELREADGTIVESWEEENTKVSESYDLESGVRYYVRAIVKVYNSSGRVIETATEESSVITAR